MNEILHFEANDKTLKDILFTDRKYRVPRYQRPYAWGIEQVSEFWEDLVGSEEAYFLGSFIFSIEDQRSDGYADIIDGQQRLLTVTILMAVLRDIARGLSRDTAELYQRQDIAIEDRSGKQSFRILPADTLKGYFARYIQDTSCDITVSTPDSPEEKRIRDNYVYLHEKVSEDLGRYNANDQKLTRLNALRDRLSNLIVIEVEVGREEDAYEIFETTNARGVDLSVADLLKNLIFRKMPPKEDRDLAKEFWQDMTGNIEATETDLKRFIRYFWISKYAFAYEKKVYREIKNKVTDWAGLLEDLWVDSSHYNNLLQGDASDLSYLKHSSRIYSSLSALRLMRVSQCYVLMLSILRNYELLGTDPARIFEFIEKFTFQYSVVCKLPGNKLEKIYSKCALRIQDAVRQTHEKKRSGTIQTIFADIERELRAEAPSERLFLDSFMELSYRPQEQSRRLVKYILARINGHLQTTDEHKIDFEKVNIEHVLPVSPSKEWNIKKNEIKDHVNLLGNLTLLSIIINSRVQNGPIKDKLPELSRSELPVTQDLVGFIQQSGGKWSRDQILERQARLGSLAYEDVWSLR